MTVASRTHNGKRDVVLTTGANSGIGLATAIKVAQAGYRSVGTVRTNQKAAKVHAAAEAAKVTVETKLLDVTDADACDALLDDIGADLYALVNNAGYGLTGAVEDVTDDEARQLLETMVIAPMRLARLVLPGMRRAGRGRIVNVSSVMGLATAPLAGWYQASKHGLEAVSDALRVEVARDGVQVVLVEPGGFRTGIWDDMDRDIKSRGDSPFANAYRRSRQALELAAPFMGDPELCAKVIACAIATRYPLPRYVVGADAWAITALHRVTPTLVKDYASRLALNL